MAAPKAHPNSQDTSGPHQPLLYQRVLLKLSGEALTGGRKFGIDMGACGALSEEIKRARTCGAEICLVVGGGNIFRGKAFVGRAGMDRATADNIGMLATVMNALALQSALEAAGVETRVQSAVPMTTICEPFIRRRAIRHLEKGRVVIFAAGTGNPFFTTDTGAALRATEMNCDVLIKGTQVDGVYTADPKSDPTAERIVHIDYMDVLSRDLRVMDATAISLMRENHMPIIVFSMSAPGGLTDVLHGRGVCSTISGTKGREGVTE